MAATIPGSDGYKQQRGIEMTSMSFVLLVAILLVFVAFQNWLRYQRRLLLHRERLASIERGTELPPVEAELKRRGFGVQRALILGGLVWISLGAGALSGDVSSLIGNPVSRPLGIALVGVGLSHLVVSVIARVQDRHE
jgi:hypothetical protein